MQDELIAAGKRFGASHERVFVEAARALGDRGYTIAASDSSASQGVIEAAPRFTWDDCVGSGVAAVSQHPGVKVVVLTRGAGDSTDVRVAAETVLKVPNVRVNGKLMNADLLVKMCATTSVMLRLDSLLREHALPRQADSSVVAEAAAQAADLSAYRHLVERLQGGDTLIDYTALRMAYAKTPEYAPYPVRWGANLAMFAALDRKRFEEVGRIADSILAKNYVDIDAHLGAMSAAYHRGDTLRGTFHRAVYRGLIESLKTRSGRSLDSAIIVLSIPEEYALLRSLELERKTVAGVHWQGGLYDRMEVVSRKTKKKSTLYFDASIPHAWGVARFGGH
jgi:hypothetical protein